MFVALLLCRCIASYANNGNDAIPLFDGLGKHHYLVATFKPAAQRYFDQGLILAFGFKHAETARSFREAYRIDSDCNRVRAKKFGPMPMWH